MARRAQYRMAMEMIRGGAGFEVAGYRGSGRTHFLNALEQMLVQEGWSVVRVAGLASLRSQPLGALQVASFAGSSQARMGPVPLTDITERLIAALTPQSVLMVDDWEDLDDASKGVLGAVRSRVDIPYVVSILTGVHARTDPYGGQPSTMLPWARIELAPLTHEETELTIEATLGGGKVNVDLVTNVFVLSGGNVGIAVALVEAGRRDGAIEFVGDTWIANQDLYNRSLSSLIEVYLSKLSVEAREALALLSVTGRIRLDVVRQIFDWDTIQELETYGVVTVFGSPDSEVRVYPPVIAEYFRTSLTGVKKARLRELTEGHYGFDSVRQQMLTRDSITDHVSIFVSVLNSHVRDLRIENEERWRKDRSAANAARYIRALVRDRVVVASVYDEIVELTPAPEPGAATLAEVEYLMTRASRHAYQLGDLEAARRVLTDVAPVGSAPAQLADAHLVMLETMLGTVPDDYRNRLCITADHPQEVLIPTLVALITVELVRGDPAMAATYLDRLPVQDGRYLGIEIAILKGVLHLYRAEVTEAETIARHEYMKAAEGFDPDALRTFAWLFTQAEVYKGDLSMVNKTLATISGLRDTPTRGIYQLGLLNNGVMEALHRDRLDLAERYMAEMDDLLVADGPFPSQQRGLARARVLLYKGRVAEGAAEYRRVGDAMWARGARTAAVRAYLLSQEAMYQPEHFESDRERLMTVDDNLSVANLGYFDALSKNDPDLLVNLVDGLLERRLPVWALSALDKAAEMLWAAGDLERAGEVRDRLRRLRMHLPAGADMLRRDRSVAVVLSEREREFVRMVAQGASNKMISETLSVSVRTVESTTARIAKKLNVRGRKGIATWWRSRNERAMALDALGEKNAHR